MGKTLSQQTENLQMKVIAQLLDEFEYKVDRHTLLSDIFEVSALTIANSVELNTKMRNSREARFKNIMNKYAFDDRNKIKDVFIKLFDLLSNVTDNGFDDYLGKLYMMSGTSSDRSGQFFTPYSLSKATADTCLDQEIVEKRIKSNEILTIHEPACGSGGMIIAALDTLWNKYHFNYAENVLIDCTDIDRRCVHMCYLQLSLAGVPAIVKHGNELSMEIWETWHTPALTMQWLKFRNHINNYKR